MRLSRRAAVVLAAVLLGPALPTLAAPVGPPVVPSVVRSTALSLGATTAAVSGSDQLVGVTWAAGRAQVQVRWLTAGGWTAWETPEQDTDAPEPAERRGTRPGTEPLWRPSGATLVDLRVSGSATDLRLVRVAEGRARTGPRLTGSAAHAHATAGTSRLLGGVHRRAAWGADESIREGRPKYASAVRAVVVHHTAGSNDYSRADVPRRLRADYAYHVRARGWGDLGYNLVVDRFGRIWEGRAGGLGRATVGAHAQGFNTGTLGVSLMGDMTRQRPTTAAVRAMSRVGAYAAATWRFDPRGRVTLTSGGSPRYRSGTRVTLGRVFGHRDTGRTSCPGTLYDRLGDVRRGAATVLGPAPRLVGVTVTGAPVRAPQPVVVRGRLSAAAPWSAALRDPSGTVLARGGGIGTVATLRWNGLRPAPAAGAAGAPAVLPAVVPALPGRYTWTLTVDDSYHRPARRSGAVRVALPVVPVG